MTRALLLAAVLCSVLAAGDPPPAPLPQGAIAKVGDRLITLHELETEMLKREGADTVTQWVRGNLETLDWNAMTDEAVVMAVGGHELRKRELAVMLLRSKGAQVRDDLVGIAVVEQALAKENVLIDDAAMATEYRLMERDFQRNLRKSGQGYIDFASFLRVQKKLTAEQFLAQPAVRMLAGIHALVRQNLRRELTDAKLAAKLEAERARWDIRASVDLSVIHIPWKKDEQGQVTPQEQVRLQKVAQTLWKQIHDGEVTFAKTWNTFGRTWDSSGPDGHIGWVDADGNREDEGTRLIPKKLVEGAFAFAGTLPVLLPPYAHDAGVDIALLQAKRAARKVELAEVRERLVQDVLESELEGRTKTLIETMRATTPVAFASLPDIINDRAGPPPVKP